MKISVITVTLNALPALQRTMNSVINQDYDDFEFIVVDGASTDGSVAYLKNHTTSIQKWISEPDSGIYEAMNKGVQMATGDFCLFLNAGDTFISNKTLSDIAPTLDDADIILGNEILVNEKGIMCGFTPSRGSFTLRHLLTSSVCHQSTFIRRTVLLAHPYNESLKLVSDWQFVLERFLEGKERFKTVDVDVCFFYSGGRTDRNRDLGIKERVAVLERYPEYRGIWSSAPRNNLIKRVRDHICLLNKRKKYQLR